MGSRELGRAETCLGREFLFPASGWRNTIWVRTSIWDETPFIPSRISPRLWRVHFFLTAQLER